jgi:hypothetical protein
VFNGLTGYNDIEVETASERHTLHITRTPGSPDWPVSGAALEEKFLSCAGVVLPAESARRVLDMARRITSLQDVSALSALLVQQAR